MFKVRRTMRYHYAMDLANEIEDFQCGDCVFRETHNEWPMCSEVATGIITESNVLHLVERSDGVVVCTRYRKGEPLPPRDPHQGELFDEESARSFSS